MIKIFIGGIAVEHDHLNLQMMKRFQSALNQPDFADIGEDSMKMRMIKSTEEHELYRKTARIALIRKMIGFTPSFFVKNNLQFTKIFNT